MSSEFAGWDLGAPVSRDEEIDPSIVALCARLREEEVPVVRPVDFWPTEEGGRVLLRWRMIGLAVAIVAVAFVVERMLR